MREPMPRRSLVLFFIALLVSLDREASGSNMAFRFVKPLVFAGVGAIGDNWTSIPYNSPYHTAADLCSKTGLVSTLLPRASITSIDPDTGTPTTVSCGTSAAATLVLVPGRGYKIRQPNVANARNKIVLVGVHDPSLVIQVPQFDGSSNGFWYSVPYHTTSLNTENLCHEMGTLFRGGIQRTDAATGVTTTYNCGTINPFSLVPGEAVKLMPLHAVSFIPAHY